MNKKGTTFYAILTVLVIVISSWFSAWMHNVQIRADDTGGSGITYNTDLIEVTNLTTSNWNASDSIMFQDIQVNPDVPAGTTLGDVYVRLQLKEYMDIAQYVYEYSPHRLMVNDEGEFIRFKTRADFDASVYSTHTYYEKQGLDDNQVYWYVQTQAGDNNGQYGKFLLLSANPGKAVSLVENVKRATDTEDQNTVNGKCLYTVHKWNGTSCDTCKFGFHVYIKWYLGDNVISLEEWERDGKPSVDKWIYDTTTATDTEAWVYWGEPLDLEQEDTIPHPLKKIQLLRQPDGDFYYAVHTDMEIISLDTPAESALVWLDAPDSIRNMLQTTATGP